jgi:cytoskeletal protein CcmA (bactofilin family)
MLSSFKGKPPEKDANGAAPSLPSFIAAGAPPQRLSVEPPAKRPEPAPRPEPMARPELIGKPAAKPDTVSSIGSSMSITGQVVCTGQAKVFGRVEGELRVSDLLLGEGSQVEGHVVAQEVTVRGHVKGTIRAVRVRIEDGATVEGDIFHRSLSIEEGALFEGSSRRVENPTDAPTNIPEEIPHGEPAQDAFRPQAAFQPEVAAIDAGLLAEPTGETARTLS